MDIQYKCIETKEELKASRKLRHTIFVQEQNIPEELEKDTLDAQSTHVIAVHNDTIVATGRITIQKTTAKISRVAVHVLYRRQKIGTHIITLLEKIAFKKNVQLIHLSSNIQSIPFYQTLGYNPVGDPFIECGDTAQKMVKNLHHDLMVS
ncbi:MAG: GNAT family N-acetyltransferase [Candidatus Methanofastidiosia archaeon]|jgi:predicted GNAT family N-acyltransferase